MIELAQKAVETIEGYKKNSILMEFVKKEAMEQVGNDIVEITGLMCSEEDVEFMISKDQTVSDRFDKYVKMGLVGCYLASVKNS